VKVLTLGDTQDWRITFNFAVWVRILWALFNPRPHNGLQRPFTESALLYYDYALTFKSEVNYIWKKPFRLSTPLYLCCRYALAANLIYVLAISSEVTGLEVCLILPYMLLACSDCSPYFQVRVSQSAFLFAFLLETRMQLQHRLSSLRSTQYLWPRWDN
jgi:hypothetical protein